MLRRSIEKPFQINALNLVGKIGQPSSFGENPPIRREKSQPFRPCTIKVSGEKPANTREFPSPRRAESMFWEREVAWEREPLKQPSLGPPSGQPQQHALISEIYQANFIPFSGLPPARCGTLRFRRDFSRKGGMILAM
jgi:hypothetical protein